jgi:hypothetical protein
VTTLASWVGVDSRGIASLYIVSDSRLSGFRSDSREIAGTLTDESQKIFSCETQPHIFGYVGWERYPVATLETLISLIDYEEFFSRSDDLDARQARIFGFLKANLRSSRSHGPPSPFAILHAARKGSGKNSRFGLWSFQWSPNKGWKVTKERIRKKSVILFSGGSGKRGLRSRDLAWRRKIGTTSRGAFGAFCQALARGIDPQSGGAPQLAGLFRKFGAKYFGVIYQRRCYYKGKEVAPSVVPRGTIWFNERLELFDPIAMTRRPGAQPQPSPWRSQRRKRRLP